MWVKGPALIYALKNYRKCVDVVYVEVCVQ